MLVGDQTNDNDVRRELRVPSKRPKPVDVDRGDLESGGDRGKMMSTGEVVQLESLEGAIGLFRVLRGGAASCLQQLLPVQLQVGDPGVFLHLMYVPTLYRLSTQQCGVATRVGLHPQRMSLVESRGQHGMELVEHVEHPCSFVALRRFWSGSKAVAA